ncbi:MAG: ABC transporter permease [Acidobacteriota bacterium]
MDAEELIPGPATSVLVIGPERGWTSLRLRELWEYRELLYFFVWRDVKVRYKQTVLGAAWAILQPLMSAAVFTVFFGRLAGIPSDGVPYPLFAYAGLLVWTFFSQAISQAGGSLVSSANLITKVYFPRAVVPASSVLSGLVDLAVATPVLVLLMVYYGVNPGGRLILVPVVLILAVGSAFGVGLWLSALTVEYRDVRYVVPFLVQIWLFMTPVIYPASQVGPLLASRGLPVWLLGLNPMAGVVEGFRWAVVGTPTAPWSLLASSALFGAAVLVSGAFYFRATERSFADVV